MITSNADEVVLKIKNIGKQLPFAVSKALNSTAEKIRQSTLQGAKDTLTLRGSWFNPRSKYGFNVKPSTKNNLQADIYTNADWMKMQEDGGIKTAKGLIAIPTKFVKRNKKDMLNKANRPKNIKGSVKVKFKNGKEAIVKPYFDGHERRLVVLYWLEKRAKIKGVYKFHDIATNTFKANIENDMKEAVNYALSTAR